MKSYEKCKNCPYPQRMECVGECIEKCTITKEDLEEQIREIISELYENDYYLIQNEVNEVCIVANFWRYFFNKFQNQYDNLDMDMEYNRNGKWAKYYGMTEEGRRLYAKPDMIIHKRGCNYHNFLCIEFKGYWNAEDENDDKKLRAFTNQDILLDYDGKRYSYRYTYGIRLRLYDDRVEFKWFEKGQHVEKYDATWKRDKKCT